MSATPIPEAQLIELVGASVRATLTSEQEDRIVERVRAALQVAFTSEQESRIREIAIEAMRLKVEIDPSPTFAERAHELIARTPPHDGGSVEA